MLTEQFCITRYVVDFADTATHTRMLRNLRKYRAFGSALARTVRGKSVLEIGAGSGVLSLLSAALGAQSVTAIERNPVVTLTKTVLEQFKDLAKRIKVVEGDAVQVDLDGKKFDIIISETIGYFGFEENIATILARAHRLWKTARTLLMPSHLTVILEPLFTSVNEDLPYLANDLEGWERPIGVPEPVPLFPFGCSGPIRPRTRWFLQRRMNVDSVGIFFRADLLPGIFLTNFPSYEWPFCIVPLGEKITGLAGDDLCLRLTFKPSEKGSYTISLTVRINGRTAAVREFDSSEVATKKLAIEPTGAEAVVVAVKNILSDLSPYRSSGFLDCEQRQLFTNKIR